MHGDGVGGFIDNMCAEDAARIHLGGAILPRHLDIHQQNAMLIRKFVCVPLPLQIVHATTSAAATRLTRWGRDPKAKLASSFETLKVAANVSLSPRSMVAFEGAETQTRAPLSSLT